MKSSEADNYEEYREISLARTWFIVAALCLFLVGSGLAVHRLLPDRPRDWNYGALDAIPGQSVYGTSRPRPLSVGPAETGKVPVQLAPPPGALPLEKLEPRGFEQEETGP